MPVSVPPGGAHSGEPDVPQQGDARSYATASCGDALRESEARLRLALTATGQGLYDLDMRTGIATVTPEYMELLGEEPSRTTIDLSSFGERVHPDDIERVSGLIDAYTCGDIDEYRDEFRLRHTSGEWRWVLSIGRVVERDESGRALRVMGSHTDITERRHVDEELTRAKDYAEKLIATANTIVVGLDGSGEIVEFNRAAELITGYSRADISGRSWFEVICPRDRYPEVWDEFLRLSAGGLPRVFENPILTKSGEERYIVWSNSEIQTGAEAPGTISFGIDVTEQRAAARALEETSALLRSIIDGTSDAVYVKDRGGRYLLFNDAACRIVDKQVEEVLGHDDTTLFPPEEARAVMESDRGVMESDETLTYEENITGADGARHAFWSTKGPIRDATGAVVGLFGVTRDITERTLMEERVRELNAELEQRVAERTEQLARANEGLEGLNRELRTASEELAQVIQGLEETNRQLDEATRAKSEFLANMSHELRTPLNSIIGFSGILRQGLAGQLNDEQSKQVRMISTAGQHLLNLINEILDLASIEAGGVHLRIVRFSARDAAVLVAQTMRPLAEQKGLEIEWDHDAPDVWLASDPTRLEQIVLNLLSNAVKFTDAGRIVLKVSAAPSGATIAVSDTGCGVPPEDTERIFEDFYQGIAINGGKHAGTGLGLSVSRRLARMLGGDIEVDSCLGRGSTFTLHLPDLSSVDEQPVAVP